LALDSVTQEGSELVRFNSAVTTLPAVLTCAEAAKEARVMAAAKRDLVVVMVRGSCDERWFMKVAAAGAVAMD
jgi:hypothetical protein